MIVMLDRQKIGVTPLELDIAAGEHAIVLVDGGTRVGERQVKILAGSTVEVTVPVVYPPDNPKYIPPPPPSRVVPIALFVGAGAVLAVTPYMFYLGQKGDSPKDRYEYPYANGTGLALVGVSAAAVGVGIWLWLREPRERESAPVATISPGGGYFGWQGRF